MYEKSSQAIDSTKKKKKKIAIHKIQRKIKNRSSRDETLSNNSKELLDDAQGTKGRRDEDR